MNAQHHLSEGTIAAFVDGMLDAAARERAEFHLAACAECRAELVATTGVVHELRQRRGGRSGWVFGAVAAAVAAVALFTVAGPPPAPPHPGDGRGIERLAGDRGGAMTIIAPVEGATVDPASLEFAWAEENDASYRLTLTDESGGTVWESNTLQTAVRLPPDLSLPAGERFYWYVDALRADGSSTSSGPRSFRTIER